MSFHPDDYPAPVRLGLRLASLPYSLAVRLRNRAYRAGWLRAYRAAVPVVSVGNLTLGGTGKTPCVEYVARFYRGLDVRVAILSRGYGDSRGRNDEALLLEENLNDVPHLQGADRVALARTAVEELESELLILDDGFQHRRLARALDIVLVDATNPWGGGNVFPRGLLREPREGLRRADVILLTRCDQVSSATVDALVLQIARLAPGKPVWRSSHQPTELRTCDGATLPPAEAAARPVAAFCGIGNPAAFRRSLEALGATVLDFREYPDHHQYTRPDIDDLSGWARTLAATGESASDLRLITTQKDLVKLRTARLGGRDLWALRVALRVEDGREALDRTLKRALQ